MALWMQNLVVMIVVGASLGALIWDFVRAARGQKPGCGTCSRCGTSRRATAERRVFLPVQMLMRRK